MSSIASLTFDDISPTFVSLQQLERLLDFLEGTDVQCTLFVVPFEFEKWSKRYVELLKSALDLGHELALHGHKHIKNEFGYFEPIPFPSFFPFPKFETQMERIEKSLKNFSQLTGVVPFGFRAPYYLHNNATFKALSKLGFMYDSSKTIFKPAYGLSFKMRWLSHVSPFLQDGILEIPVTRDYTYNLREDNLTTSIDAALEDFEWIRSEGGVFVMNNHAQRLRECGFRFLKTILRKLSKEASFLRLADIKHKVSDK